MVPIRSMAAPATTRSSSVCTRLGDRMFDHEGHNTLDRRRRSWPALRPRMQGDDLVLTHGRSGLRHRPRLRPSRRRTSPGSTSARACVRSTTSCAQPRARRHGPGGSARLAGRLSCLRRRLARRHRWPSPGARWSTSRDRSVPAPARRRRRDRPRDRAGTVDRWSLPRTCRRSAIRWPVPICGCRSTPRAWTGVRRCRRRAAARRCQRHAAGDPAAATGSVDRRAPVPSGRACRSGGVDARARLAPAAGARAARWGRRAWVSLQRDSMQPADRGCACRRAGRLRCCASSRRGSRC